MRLGGRQRRLQLVDHVRQEDVLRFVLERAAANLLAADEQIAEDAHLRAQDLGIYGLEQVIDRAVLVSFEDVRGFTAERRDEDDGNVPGLLPLLDQLCGLQAIESRHLDVEQDHRERVSQELQERLLAGPGFHQPRSDRLQHALQREEVLGPIVDQQHAGNDAIGFIALHGGPLSTSRSARSAYRDRRASSRNQSSRPRDSARGRRAVPWR